MPSEPFDYDLDEVVHSGAERVTLRTAVQNYIAAKRSLAPGQTLVPPMWVRQLGKRPSIFEIEHLEVLSQLPEIRGGL